MNTYRTASKVDKWTMELRKVFLPYQNLSASIYVLLNLKDLLLVLLQPIESPFVFQTSLSYVVLVQLDPASHMVDRGLPPRCGWYWESQISMADETLVSTQHLTQNEQLHIAFEPKWVAKYKLANLSDKHAV